jgi:hypothetical protein
MCRNDCEQTLASEELLRLICELVAEALRALLKIYEPHTVKIGEDDSPKEAMEKLCDSA